MDKKRAVAVRVLVLVALLVGSGSGADVDLAEEFKTFSLDGYFSCEVPQGWQLLRDDKEQRRGVFQIELIAPGEGPALMTIYVSYFSEDNIYFKDYQDYVESNSTDDLGIAAETDKYGPVSTTALSGRKAFEFEREQKEYLHPESPSDESVILKEKFYVLPAREGFFVMHFSAPKAVYEKRLPVFDRVARTFKGRL